MQYILFSGGIHSDCCSGNVYQNLAYGYNERFEKYAVYQCWGAIKENETGDAAAMLHRLANLLGVPSGSEGLFADDSMIADFAKDAVYAMSAAKVMNGVEDNRFDPLSLYTVEQSIVAMLRLYNAVNVQ